MMVRKQIGVGGAFVSVLAATMLAVSACSSGGGSAEPAASSSASIQSASVAPGVEKDSVLDLNSTKDMTGVVTTVPIGKSPYDKNMPDICNFITPEAMSRLGVASKDKGFSGSPLVAQNCSMSPSANNDIFISAEIYVNNLQEHLSRPNLVKEQPNPLAIARGTNAYILTDRNYSGMTNVCEVAWGTFYGTAAVSLTDNLSAANICQRAINDAKIIAPLMPKSPSEMRPTS
ncbi:MAG: hypothetical protein NTW76_11675 [Corynebacteriales bacterium]|nr:hypothetical protein [Mycobacteriales bacterium]